MHDRPTPPGEGTDPPAQPPSPLAEPSATASERIKVIIEAAEQAAAGIIEDAEAQANRYLEKSRDKADRVADQRVRAMSDLTDSLLDQAETVKRESDQLIAALDKARDQIESPSRPGLAAAPAGSAVPEEGEGPEAPDLKPVEPEAPSLRAVPSAVPEGFSDGARLLATQMAVAGSSRDEIKERLRNDFGIEDASLVLDGILGPE